MTVLVDLFLLYVCPSVGVMLGTAMNAAPLRALGIALQKGDLCAMNTLVWAFAAGNTWGWALYGFWTQDLFVLAPNVPGLLFNLWLNYGAAKIQYHILQRNRLEVAMAKLRAIESLSTASTSDDSVETASTGSSPGANASVSDDIMKLNDYFVPQEVAFFRIAAVWMLITVYSGWFVADTTTATRIIGICVNLNLIFFYASPLARCKVVVHSRDSSSIHRTTMVMNFANAFFWFLYGCAKRDVWIFFPNGMGSFLGMTQMVLCALYPPRSATPGEVEPLLAVKATGEQETSIPVLVV